MITKKRKQTWKSFLSTSVRMDLTSMGQRIKISRKRQQRTQLMIAKMLGVDPRVVASVEKGAPEVSVGIYFQYMNLLDLMKGWKLLFEPDLDLKSLHEEIKRARKAKRPTLKVQASKVDF